MGIIKTAQNNQTGVSMLQTYNNAVSAINNVTNAKTTFEAQVSNMKANSNDFTEEDWKEVESLLTDLNERIKNLWVYQQA